ncbi:MAG: glycerophosphodiester phosphodiesterase [Bacteroidia bacterium]|nr:glycerophosphodiester phosphodiesterase [Bacteroidia bacterium]
MTSCTNTKKIEVQGHRGFRGHYPENTIMGFKKAAELGVDVLELDICISKDRQVVVSHEPFMNPVICRTAEGNRITPESALNYNIYRMNYEQVRAFDCGTLPHPDFPEQRKIKVSKPKLSDVFDALIDDYPAMRYNIEIKADSRMDGIFTPEPKAYVDVVVSLLKAYQLEEKITLQSFDIRILEEIHDSAPEISIALLVDHNETMDDKLATLTFKPEIISPDFSLLNAQNVADYQDSGFLIIPWTVNSEDDLQRMIDARVDGIITDYPNHLLDLLNK